MIVIWDDGNMVDCGEIFLVDCGPFSVDFVVDVLNAVFGSGERARCLGVAKDVEWREPYAPKQFEELFDVWYVDTILDFLNGRTDAEALLFGKKVQTFLAAHPVPGYSPVQETKAFKALCAWLLVRGVVQGTAQ